MIGNKKRLRLLLVIVITMELLAITGLAVWGLTKSDPEKPTANNPAAVETSGLFGTTLIARDLMSPTSIATTPIAGDDRLFVTERPGFITIINKNDGDQKPFMDITGKVKDNDSEMGLLGLAFHPDFADNGYFYVNYTDKQDNTIIARYKMNDKDQAEPLTEKVLLKIKQPYENHNGGALAFGPDGFLYVALGDGGSGGDPQNRAQNKGELLGKILRLDVDAGDPYAIPAGNPFANEAGAKPEIWAWGLRNPWRISFDKQTGDLYIADVGQNKLEEVNVQKAASEGGENYGWRCYEGSQVFNTSGNCGGNASQFVMPTFEYAHENDRCSIAGGYVYRGANTDYTGKYIFGDTCSGEIFAASQSDDGKWNQKVILKTSYYISTFGEDQDGELYLADLKSGNIYRLQN